MIVNINSFGKIYVGKEVNVLLGDFYVEDRELIKFMIL